MTRPRRLLVLLLCAGLAGGVALAVGAQCHAAAASTCCCEGEEPMASCALACAQRNSDTPISVVRSTTRDAFERASLATGALPAVAAARPQVRSLRLAAVARASPPLRPDPYLLDCALRL